LTAIEFAHAIPAGMDQVVLGGPPWTKGGHGFNNVAWWDDLGVPLAHGVVPMHYP
jgi:hypothetical protein